MSFDKRTNSNPGVTIGSYATSVNTGKRGKREKNRGDFKKNREGNNRRNRGKKGDGDSKPKEELYCKVHGNCFHTTEQCRTLKQEANEKKGNGDRKSSKSEKRQRDAGGSNNRNIKPFSRNSTFAHENSEKDAEVNATSIFDLDTDVLYRRNESGKYVVANTTSVKPSGKSIYESGEGLASRGGVSGWCNMTTVSTPSVKVEQKVAP